MKLNFEEIQVLQDAHKSLLNNEFLSDIKFTFPDGKFIFAHSFVLACRSDDFCESFEANIGQSKLITINNANHDEYFEFLKYLYTDSCQIDQYNVESIMKLSKKHNLRNLETKCCGIMEGGMKVNNACTILQKSIELDCDELKQKSAAFITKNYFECLSEESFLEINRSTLSIIVNMDRESTGEDFKIFKATLKWATAACIANGKQPNGVIKRDMLGDVLKFIRFDAMSVENFTKCINLEPDLLQNDEIVPIFVKITTSKMELDHKNRNNIQDCVKFGEILYTTNCFPDIVSYCMFSVSHPITLKQIKLQRVKDVKSVEIWDERKIIQFYKISKPFRDVVNLNYALGPHKKYKLIIRYARITYSACTKNETQINSVSEGCVFTIFYMSTLFHAFIFSPQ